jgi:cytochrome bd ubiquinol oxidase subunit I
MRVSDAVTGNDGLELGFLALVVIYLGLGGAVVWLLRRLAARPPEREVAHR